jgi:N-acetylmuramate 1-kinase
MDTRQQQLEQWLKTHCQIDTQNMLALAGDASFRRYFRVKHDHDSFIAMDAPPPQENCLPFVAIADALRQKGLTTPQIIASDLTNGFLLLSDFGDDLYLKTLTMDNAELLYSRALDSLSILQSCRRVKGLTIPVFTSEFMYNELQLSKEWFLQKHLQLNLSVQDENMLHEFFKFLADMAAGQPQVFMHRDFHSANLMVIDNDVGILDFQDAFMGPVTYDVVSLLKDCYIDWPEELIKKLVLQYKLQIGEVVAASDEQFLRWFDFMGMQRHLKALLTFARKYHRDGNANYLQHMPRTLNYLHLTSERYAESKAFHAFLINHILPAMQNKVTVCVQ